MLDFNSESLDKPTVLYFYYVYFCLMENNIDCLFVIFVGVLLPIVFLLILNCFNELIG